MSEREAYLLSCTNSEIPELAKVAEFYDRTFRAALQGCCSIPVFPAGYDFRRTVEGCEVIAQHATERRFGIRLILPGEAE